MPQAAGGVASAGLDSAGFVSVLLAAGFWPPLKSVAYQPLPVNRKLGADTCLAKVSLPQAGQTVRFGSLILRITSAL